MRLLMSRLTAVALLAWKFCRRDVPLIMLFRAGVIQPPHLDAHLTGTASSPHPTPAALAVQDAAPWLLVGMCRAPVYNMKMSLGKECCYRQPRTAAGTARARAADSCRRQGVVPAGAACRSGGMC
ncbi:hypothetical protein ABPG75_006653 [Micractinium tetrahymenae]